MEQAGRGTDDWKALVAVAAVADDLTAAGIVRFAQVDLDTAAAAIDAAAAHGVLVDGVREPAALRRLVADLPVERVAEVHAAAARHLLAAGPDRLLDAIDHARAAGLPLEEIVSMADRAGRMSLGLGDYHAASQMLAVAADLDTSDDLAGRGRRLCDLADAVAGLGDDRRSKDLLLQAAQLGELSRDGALVARAAVTYAVPADWNYGDPQTGGLLHRAASMDLATEDRVAVQAARALVEMRIPLHDDPDVQVAWVTRPAVAQPISEDALARSASCSDAVRLLAMLAWRSNHRAPAFLERRREISADALALAQHLRDPLRQVEAAVWLAVDALESGDRPLFDETLAVARWVAARDGNPRLEWRALTLAAGAAHLDGDTAAGRELAAHARKVAEPLDVPGWFGAELFLECEAAVGTDDLAEMAPYLVDEDNPVMTSALGRSFVGWFYLRHGQPEVAERFVERAFRQFDEEASYLLLGTRLAATVARLDRADLARDLVARLTPWADHTAVDSHAWFCDGPVALPLAELHHSLGDDDLAASFLDAAEPVARALNDVRSLRRAAALRSRLSPARHRAPVDELTARQVQILRLIATGATNPQIAERLAYSVSTIRVDTIAIYRTLGVTGRAEAVARAVEMGLTAERPTT